MVRPNTVVLGFLEKWQEKLAADKVIIEVADARDEEEKDFKVHRRESSVRARATSDISVGLVEEVRTPQDPQHLQHFLTPIRELKL